MALQPAGRLDRGQISLEYTPNAPLAKKTSSACRAKLSTQEGQLCTLVPTNLSWDRFSAVRHDLALPGLEMSSGRKTE